MVAKTTISIMDLDKGRLDTIIAEIFINENKKVFIHNFITILLDEYLDHQKCKKQMVITLDENAARLLQSHYQVEK